MSVIRSEASLFLNVPSKSKHESLTLITFVHQAIMTCHQVWEFRYLENVKIKSTDDPPAVQQTQHDCQSLYITLSYLQIVHICYIVKLPRDRTQNSSTKTEEVDRTEIARWICEI